MKNTVEKRFLVISIKGKAFGAFEDVALDSVIEKDNSLAFKSSEGNFIFNKNEDGLYEDADCIIKFDEYKLLGARALKARGIQAPDRRKNKFAVNIAK